MENKVNSNEEKGKKEEEEEEGEIWWKKECIVVRLGCKNDISFISESTEQR